MIGCGVVVTASGCVVVAMSAVVVGGGAVVDAMAAAAVVVGREGGCEEKDMVADTRLVRRALLRRKYGGEKASRGLAGRRRDGAVLQPRVWRRS